MTESIFTKIINGDIPGHVIYEDEVCVAILDKFPAVPGQTLVIPREETDYIFALTPATYQHLWEVARTIAAVLDTHFHTTRTCVVVEGFEVQHAHIKLYPMVDETPLGRVLPNGTEAHDTELAPLAKTLRTTLRQ